MRSLLAVLLSLSFTLPSAFAIPQFELDFDPVNAEERTLPEYWRDVGLKLDHIRPMITTENCYSEENGFIGCFAGINGALQTAKDTYVLIPSSRLTAIEGKYEVAADFKVAKIIKMIPEVGPLAPKQEGLATIVKKLKEERAKNNAEIVALFKQGKKNGLNYSLVMDWMDQNIIKQPSSNESYLVASLYNGFLGAAVDPHTYTMPAAYWDHRDQVQSVVFYGIGATLKLLDKKLLIDSPMDGSPALKAGIRANDEIIAIDGKPIDFSDIGNNVKLIKGAEGTTVTLTIRRKSQTMDIQIVRGKIERKNVEYSVINHRGNDIGYIKLTEFIEKSCDGIKSAVTALNAKNVSGFILDLRQNGGGRLDQADCIVGIFVGPNKTVVVQKSLDPRTPDQKEVTPFNAIQMTKLPVVTLIDEHSASASEIVSGALQDYKRSLILGERSFGKATVQRVFPLDHFGSYALPVDNSMYFMRTMARFYLPSGRTNQIVGILPDVEIFHVPNPTEDDKVAFREEDAYVNSLPPAGPAYVPNRPQYVSAVKSCLSTTGKADELYADQLENSALAPDYQKLNAEDALICMLSVAN